jgi:hypothetical protein
MTPLCELAEKYGVDKCPKIRHAYTPFYYNFLKNKDIKKVLEVGIGHYKDIESKETFYHRQLDREWSKGGSLKMWRDFFPEATIYGVDIEKDCLFEDERIKTFQGDERNQNDWERILKQTGTDIDLFIDDGLHHPRYQVRLCKFILPKLKKGAIYVIEDVKEVDRVVNDLRRFKCAVPELEGQTLSEERIVLVTL